MGMEGLQNLAEPAVRRWLIVGAILLALCLAMIFLLVIRAHAAPAACGSLKALLKQAADVYHEFIVMTGDATGHQMVVTMSATGTFTVFLGDGSQAAW
ncbi:hypothetical protein NKI80_07130 [Mesorhizobium sp. M0387]|uniref:hypothetical protein n=1 Tax=Mesorhizobium sp. M0387 TaxID=2956940 RepID=UPI0033365981